ncbi:Flp family type IVb pilin [Bacillus sp. DJP31]|uniref:Flp family type IVb pilin n=1 Tax=Bacillus sp. DJP31 TaxID=3409789 RepID=UPI003BB5A8A1
MKLYERIKQFTKDEQGQGMTEYGLVLGIIAVAVITTISVLSEYMITLFEKVEATVLSRHTE